MKHMIAFCRADVVPVAAFLLQRKEPAACPVKVRWAIRKTCTSRATG
jgi:hypothetical protein